MLKKLYNFFFRKKPIILNYDQKREVILSYQASHHTNVFIETGTFMGDTVFALLNNFEKIYSIELSEELANKAQKRFREFAHVRIINGDSGTQISSIIDVEKSPAIFWLDGHYSGEFDYQGTHIKTAKGKLNTPIESELRTIFSSGLPHVILIDDARLFLGQADYPTLTELNQLFKLSKITYSFTVKDDIIRIIPKV